MTFFKHAAMGKSSALPILTVSLRSVLDNSFKNFHARGLDYICLHRSADYTLKLYYLNGDVAKLPEAVNPHDHRYSFQTKVLAGELADFCWRQTDTGESFEMFHWDTPLNGGDGFSWADRVDLTVTETAMVETGGVLRRSHDAIHTIRPLSDQTVLMLEQFEDVVPVGQPTRTFIRSDGPAKAPDLSGLYEAFSPDEAISRIETISALAGVPIHINRNV